MFEGKWSKSRYPQTCALLESCGIDPFDIPEDGLLAEGYETVVKDSNGRPVWGGNDRPVREFHEWPESVDGERVYRTFLAERWGAPS